MSTSGAVLANIWQHVVVTRRASTRTVNFYVNGVSKGGGPYGFDAAAGSSAISLGRSDHGVQYVDGRLDEIALYPHVLSAARIASHYALASQIAVPTSPGLQLVASDPNNDPITFSAAGLPARPVAECADGADLGSLSRASAGTHTVTATATAGGQSDTKTFTWSISHVNHAPQLSDPGAHAAIATENVSLALVATDWDGDALAFSATGLPAPVTLNPATGLIAGVFSAAGVYTMTATVTDGTVEQPYVHVDRDGLNRAPLLTNPGAQTTSAIFSYQGAVQGDVPVAYWRLHDGVGVCTDAMDHHPAAVMGGVTTGHQGPLADGSRAMGFNGANAYVRVPDAAALQLSGDLTLELWINVAAGVRQTLISKDYLHEFELTLETTGRLDLYQGNGVQYQGVLSAVGSVVPNTWQHIVVTRSAATKTIAFYVNSVAKGGGGYWVTPTSGTSAIAIGRALSGLQ